MFKRTAAAEQTKLWHYTTLDVLRHFCCDSKPVFHASHNLFSNDVMEADDLIRHIVSQVKKRLDVSDLTKRYCDILSRDKFSDKPRACFIVSLTECGDSLPLWNEYTSRSPYGVAVGFGLRQTGWKRLLRKCSYYESIEDVEKRFVESMNSAVSQFEDALRNASANGDWREVERCGEAVDDLVVNLAYMKHESFKYEQEWRFVIERRMNKLVHFNEWRPYIDVPLFGTAGLFSGIEEIRISPYANNTVRKFCEALCESGFIKADKDIIKMSSSTVRNLK